MNQVNLPRCTLAAVPCCAPEFPHASPDNGKTGGPMPPLLLCRTSKFPALLPDPLDTEPPRFMLEAAPAG